MEDKITLNPTEKLRAIRHLALDMDGTIYLGDRLLNETKPFLQTLRELNIGWTFVTNNSSKGVAEYVRHLDKFGIDASPADIFTSTHAAIALVRRAAPAVNRWFALGTPAFKRELGEAGLEIVGLDGEPQGVLVGFDTDLSYRDLCKTAFWIARGLPYFATHPDLVCPTDQPTILLDCGAICAAIEAATGRKPDAIAGKPERAMLDALARRCCLENHQLAMVGDRIYTDVAMAKRAGAMGVLTLTGETQREDVANSEVAPDLMVKNLGELGTLLCDAQS